MRPERDERLIQRVRKVTEDKALLHLASLDKAPRVSQEAVRSAPNFNHRDPDVDWASEIITEEVAILVSDMSGFTRTVREHGILHFASIIARKRQVCMPIFQRRGAIKVLTEGDDVIAIFRSVAEGALAAVEMQQTIACVNRSLPPGSEKFTIKLGGIGVHCGSGIVIDKHGNVSGEPFRGAYYLGETLCEGGKVLFSSAVLERVRGEAAFAAAAFEPETDDTMECFCVTGVESLVREDAIPPADDGTHIDPELLPLARRYLPGADLLAIDADMARQHIKTYSVLMFDLDLSNIGPSPNESEVLQAKFRGLRLISEVLERHRGRGLEDLLWIFENAADALVAALAVRDAVRASNEDGSGAFVEVTGYGIHCGSLLLIEGTDVHWGDPVNTASKLGQDIASGGEILASAQVREAAAGDGRCEPLSFQERSTTMSGTDFVYFSVDKGGR